MKLRIAFSTFLNSVPLGWSFLEGPLRDEFEVTPALPADCADQLAAGAVQIGLIPSIEYQRIPDLRIIPGMAVACSSRVRSVLLVQRREGGEIRTVALDMSSRTSVVLAKLLLEAKVGLRPVYVPHVPKLNVMLDDCDAAILIGDNALQVTVEEYQVTDLAKAWIEWQQLPFVFAFWACRTDGPLPPDLVPTFEQAKEYGLRCRPEIAARYSKTLGLPESFLAGYLLENVDYRLGSRHIEGLEKFYALARLHGLLPDLRPVRFLTAGAPVGTA